MEDETHQEGDSITFFFTDRLCEIVFVDNGFKLRVGNECGNSAYQAYAYQSGEGTITMDGNYTCIHVADLPDVLEGTVDDLEQYLDATFIQSEWATNINWRNAVEWFEV